MSNRATGNQAEQEFCKALASHGFWVHNMAQNKAGQPADVIAVRDGEAYLIDVKDCSTEKGFEFSRIEPNQQSAMVKWELCGNNQALFALRYDWLWYIVTYDRIRLMMIKGKKSLTPEDILYDCSLLEKWVINA